MELTNLFISHSWVDVAECVSVTFGQYALYTHGDVARLTVALHFLPWVEGTFIVRYI